LAIHKQRREAYLNIARNEPERCAVIDASNEPAEVEKAVAEAASKALHKAGVRPNLPIGTQ
jgi:dTMP kinase